MTTTVHGPEQGQLTFTDPSPLRATDRRLILGVHRRRRNGAALARRGGDAA